MIINKKKLLFLLITGISIIIDAQAFFLWDDDPPPKRYSSGECNCSREIQEQVQALNAELEKVRRDFQNANERIKVLENSLNATERQTTDLQQQNINLQEGRDMAHADIDLMRAEMKRCTGDRSHLDEVMLRYHTCQNQKYDIHQRLFDCESSFAGIIRERDTCKTQINWMNNRLESTLKENDRLRQSCRKNLSNNNDARN